MNIYIDESGSFVSAPKSSAWNVVAAYVSPESDWTKLESVLKKVKDSLKHPQTEEIKLYQLDEKAIANFLQMLEPLNGILFCTATDAGLNTLEIVKVHQITQVLKIRENLPRMKYEGGREGLELLATQIELLSPQLYAQLVCQVSLLHEILSRAITYYAQRIPGTLGAFRWRIDQKNSTKTDFEDAFEKIAPPLLQSRSLRDPVAFVQGFNYTKLKRYEFPDGKLPNYLKEEYGIEVNDGFNVQKVIREDIQFLDSKASFGIQIVDLLASATRKCLRSEFERNDEIASLLGRLMVQRSYYRPPVELICFDRETIPDQRSEKVARIMRNQCKPLLRKTR